MITIKGLSKQYNKKQVLKDVSLTLPDSGLVCILGESGSGKTTLLNAIGGIDDFEAGSITVGDTTFSKYEPRIIEPLRNDRFGYVFQGYYLLNDYTVEHNVKLALSRYELSEAEKDERCNYVLDMLGIRKYKKKLVSRLSGGQKQRVSIARALIKSPSIILADEPTGNLDEENTIKTMMILKNIAKECLVLLVTHERRIAEYFADRIIEVADGIIVKDSANRMKNYEMSDDSNLYLKEFEVNRIQGDFANINLFYDKGSKPEPVDINIVIKDGKIYIGELENMDVLVAGEAGGVRMIDSERPKLDITDIERFEYDLKPPKKTRKATLPFKELLNMALTNIRMLAKKQAFLMIVMIAAAIMLSITLARFVNVISFNKDDVVKTDSHYISGAFRNLSIFSTDEKLQILEFAWDKIDNCEYGEAFWVPDTSLYLAGEGYLQFSNLMQRIQGFSYVDIKHLDSKDLVMGRMPEKRTEIVVDMKVINQLMKSNGIVSAGYASETDYLGAKLKTAISKTELTITGICDSNEPTVYVGQTVLFDFASSGYKVATISEMKKDSEGRFDNVELAEDEIMIREGIAELSGDTLTLGDDKVHAYKVVGYIPDDYAYDYVISDNCVERIRDLMIYKDRKFYMYCDNTEAAREYFESLSSKKFSIELETPVDKEIEAYKKNSTVKVDIGYLITIVIVIISLIMMYFSVKTGVLSRSEELTVYRLIGITKGCIMKTYALEMLIKTAMTSLPAILICSLVIKVIAGIPSLQIDMLLPWYYVAGLIVVVFVINALISILPVRNVLSKPPAALTIKE